MRHAPWTFGIGAVAISGLMAVGGTTVGHIGLDAAAPLVLALIGAVALAFAIVRQAVWRRVPAPVSTSAPQPRRIGGPRVF